MMSVAVLSVAGAAKSFAGVVALRSADLSVGPGEIHALLGENGAGKSTLIKLLAGVYAADAGSFEIAGATLPHGFGPADVAAAGLRFVHQDFGLIETMSVAENMALVGGFAHRFGMIDYAEGRRRATRRLEQLGLRLDPDTLVGEMPVAERAILALARSMEDNARLIVLDEVTAALPSPDVGRVHAAIRAARDKGVSFIYVSHRLEEVFQLCDRFTVLRDGATVASAAVGDASMERIVEWIAGRPLSAHRSAAGRRDPGRLKLAGLTGAGISAPVDLDVASGEILGLTGVIGSGYDRICQLAAGIDPAHSGTIEIDGTVLSRAGIGERRAAGMEVVLGDRTHAAFAERSVRENLFADGILRKGGLPDLVGERGRTGEIVTTYGIRPAGCGERAMQTLSGGNQQKVLFARALMHGPKVIVLVDPTAGVDVGARAELHALLRKAASGGAAVLFGSSDFEEVAAVAHRVVMVRDGRASADIAGENVTWDRLFVEAHAGHAATVSAEGDAKVLAR